MSEIAEKEKTEKKEKEEKELFKELDEDISELLSIVHMIRIDMMIGTPDRKDLEKALLLNQRIQENLHRVHVLVDGIDGVKE